MAELEEVSSAKCFGGYQKIFKHKSAELGSEANFSVYIPPIFTQNETFPVLYWLSGLTCTEKNFIEKSGFQQYASQHKVVVVGPDTSPRGLNIEGEEDSWDFGTGAGYYVDAITEKWKNYRMYSYVTKELPTLVQQNFPVDPTRQSIFGHSMGGHGALICFLKNPGMFKSVSALAPIANMSMSPWGMRAFTAYLGPDKEAWKEYDATELVRKQAGKGGEIPEILIDQGTEDEWFKDGKAYLLPEHFVDAAKEAGVPVKLRMQEGYGHNYYFVSTFIRDHFEHHAKHLTK
ncbi:hypothetical protein RvY_02514 [Ramazzottius varieornatus]|uniref:S-formylglutathione hydrolase n=1 Tax=Ramazzottius varieornatus TaxID=947166 RepID=A0A1D1UK05_RAMVA|nr:hypothetical protein RvY_02514 [Ramazzottius varieornatus]